MQFLFFFAVRRDRALNLNKFSGPFQSALYTPLKISDLSNFPIFLTLKFHISEAAENGIAPLLK